MERKLVLSFFTLKILITKLFLEISVSPKLCLANKSFITYYTVLDTRYRGNFKGEGGVLEVTFPK